MKVKYLIFIILFVGIFIAGCSVQSGYKVKSFFFDGVPNPNAFVVQDTTVTIIEKDSVIVEAPIVKKEETLILGSIHTPFKEYKCFECHDEKNRTKGKLPLTELCYTCHNGFKKSYPIVHGPAESGRCTMCHSPHKTDEKKLIYSSKQDLCLQCHEQHDVMANTIHTNIEEQSCLECHNPHGGENRAFLKKEACLQCHNSITDKKATLHGPVDAGECATCHLPHESKEPKLLVINGTSLCLRCHVTKDVYSKPYHVKNKKQSCIACHNPHGSNEAFLLIKPINSL
ncbi:cytochrome c3 family protein [Aestuariivivens sp. NBU2969]|uniref:cytochrome c3 family protein n=1 Tax=Aestuariivivens sp. NBU2969 TaxID=2873267 RepID=UPI001CBF2C78|nr:cytochrome c3 family protein [Aestuariivivens sp. NBU2969]